MSHGKPKDKSFGDIVKLVRDHLTQPPSCIVHRFHFNSCVQRETESVAQFVAELRRLSESGDLLDVMLQDRLVCGSHDAPVQRRLFTEPKLTFTKAFELAQAADLAERSVNDVVRPVGAVHTLQEPKPATATGEITSLTSCYCCGSSRHSASICCFRSVDCHKCGKKYGGPVGRGYEQRFESKNEYEQRSESKIAYGPRTKLRTVQEQNCVRSESKIAYGPRAKLRMVREQKRAGAESKNAYELTAVCGPFNVGQ